MVEFLTVIETIWVQFPVAALAYDVLVVHDFLIRSLSEFDSPCAYAARSFIG